MYSSFNFLDDVYSKEVVTSHVFLQREAEQTYRQLDWDEGDLVQPDSWPY